MKPSIARCSRQLPSSSTSQCRTSLIAARQFHSSLRSLRDHSSSPPQRSRPNPRRDNTQSRPAFQKRNQSPRTKRSSRKSTTAIAESEATTRNTNNRAPPPAKERVPGLIPQYQDARTISAQEKSVKVPITFPRPSSVTGKLLTPESLITNHIATASASPHAHRATILNAQAHLARRPSTTFGFDDLLAKALRFGKVVRFANEDEKLRAVALAQEQSDTAARRIGLASKAWVQAKKIEFMAAPKKYRDELVGRVAKGVYLEEKSREKGAMADIAKRLWLNETYLRKSGRGFMGIIKKIVPQTMTRKA